MNDQQQQQQQLQHACLFEALEYEEPLSVIETIVEMLPNSVRIRHQSSLPLHVACEKGNSLEVIRFLVQVFPESVCCKDGNECLPLHLACNNPHCGTAIVQFLVKKYPKALNMPNRMGFLPIHFACMNNSVETVRYLIQKCPGSVHYHKQQPQKDDNNNYNKHGYTLLHVACKGTRRTNSLEMIQFLLKEYPEMVSTPSRNGCLPLYFFLMSSSSSSSNTSWCLQKEDEATVLLCLTALVNANHFSLFAKTAWGETPLQFCCKHRPTLYHAVLKDRAEIVQLSVHASRERLQQVARQYKVSPEVVQSQIWTFLIPDFAASSSLLAYTTTTTTTAAAITTTCTAC